MKTSHRNKATTGLVLWISLTLILLVLMVSLAMKQQWATSLPDNVKLAVVAIGLIVPFLSFFWTAHHLAVGKGQSNVLIVFGIFGPLAQMIMLAVLISLPDKFQKNSNRVDRKKSASPSERIFNYRGKSLPRILVGSFGVLLAIFLWIFSGWLADPDHELVTILFIFIAAYSAVINGCYYWIKAKGWNDGVVVIGFLPVIVLLIPFVRLIFVVIPWLLPVSMAMITFILLIVVASLPDKSGLLKRKSFDVSDIKEN